LRRFNYLLGIAAATRSKFQLPAALTAKNIIRAVAAYALEGTVS